MITESWVQNRLLDKENAINTHRLLNWQLQKGTCGKEYCGGGDLMMILMKEDMLTEKRCKFYISEVTAAINAIHELGFVYRYEYMLYTFKIVWYLQQSTGIFVPRLELF